EVLGEAVAHAIKITDGSFHAGLFLPIPVHPQYQLAGEVKLLLIEGSGGHPDVGDLPGSCNACNYPIFTGFDHIKVFIAPGAVVTGNPFSPSRSPQTQLAQRTSDQGSSSYLKYCKRLQATQQKPPVTRNPTHILPVFCRLVHLLSTAHR